MRGRGRERGDVEGERNKETWGDIKGEREREETWGDVEGEKERERERERDMR